MSTPPPHRRRAETRGGHGSNLGQSFSGPDNCGNVPFGAIATQYTANAGDRIACGAIEMLGRCAGPRAVPGAAAVGAVAFDSRLDTLTPRTGV